MKREELYGRTERLLGREGMERLKNARVLLFGVGGVGSYCLEALARSGIGAITVVDADTVAPSNINRQLVADLSTVGRDKVEVARERILAVNPACRVEIKKMLYLPACSEEFDFSSYDYIVDAIDNVSAKLSLVTEAVRAGTKIISAMGTGNKLCPEMLEVADISKTSVCPLARVMRTELRKRGIHHLKVVYSKEEPIRAPEESGERVIGSVSFVPSVAGLLMAAEVIKDIADCK
ncbi:MAG: tRNA threonylcarbamoyladenosine dehydratase [Clostridia bacterium]|nr:tRNA threonylcarbamoyladenosine dehydratase [Clostridia bacterium]